MFVWACLGVLLLLPILGFAQADTNSPGADSNPVDVAPMHTPPPVSGAAYSTDFTTETQSNSLRVGVTFGTAYSSNVEGSPNPISDVSYSLWPTLAFYASTARARWDVSYAPGFTFYQHTSSLNQGDQNLTADFQYRLTPHLTVSLRDSFQKTSNPFNQPNPDSATSISGSSPPPNLGVIAPYADQVRNLANVGITYQLSADGMVGASGTFTNLHYPNPAEVPGLYDSSSTGASIFYSRRFLSRYYVGASYQYQDVLAYQSGAEASTQTLTNTIFGFFTFYLSPTLSLSVSGGPQHSDTAQPPLPVSQSWSPLLMGSLSWQGKRTSLAASYARVVTGGGGLVGSYHSNIANLSGAWQLSRNWTVGLSASYSLYSTLTPLLPGANSGGKTVSITASVQRPIGEHLALGAGFTRLQQSYPEVPTISAIPDTNRVFVSISYQLTRPLKR